METIQSANSRFSLLIVEDDKAAIEIISLMIPLKFPQVTIYVANNGEQGVELCKEHKPEVVITDINMPGMDGIHMAKEIKTIRADTKFIVLTGYSDKITLDKFSKIGISDYIVKPLDFKKLFVAIEKCITEISSDRLVACNS